MMEDLLNAQFQQLSDEDVQKVNQWIREANELRARLISPNLTAGAVIMAVADLARVFETSDPQLWDFCRRVVAQGSVERVLN